MSDTEQQKAREEELQQLPFCLDYDKRGQAKCKQCKNKFDKGEFRLGRYVSNPFGEGMMKSWNHVKCMFESFKRARATTKKIDDPEVDIEDWAEAKDEDQQAIQTAMEGWRKHCKAKGISPATTAKKDTPKKATPKKDVASTSKEIKDVPKEPVNPLDAKFAAKDDSFREFRRLCAAIADESSYLSKTELVHKFFSKGSGGDKFRGDLELWVRLLLPGVIKRVYNLQSKQLVKVFAQVFEADHDDMLKDLEEGDVAETIRVFFDSSQGVQATAKSAVTLQHVDKWLTELEKLTKEEDQISHLAKVARQCTSNDLKMIVRIIKADLRINAGAKHILDGVHPDAYNAFQTTRNITAVLKQVRERSQEGAGGLKRALSIKAKVLTPVLPMLAQACKSVEQAFKKCPNGMYSEIKYDGERVQVHKTGDEFKYFSRSLKPVMNHKVSLFEQYIPEAFPHGNDLILDAEVLMIDTRTGEPLPFGTLGVHKKSEFEDAQVCLYVFDCIHYNGENLMNKPLSERRNILLENMTEVEHRVLFSEMKEIHKHDDLREMIAKVLSEGLEGLVLKDIKSVYEPGKRHWLKVKKDYLADGAMADSADLVVLGAWYGTGKKGGMMSVFLMGCYNPSKKQWCTVTKVHTGHDDEALKRLQKTLKMDKISGDYAKVPNWLDCSRSMAPDFVAKDPKNAPVWEITGAEFTQNKIHSADGISIRFPRVTKERDDKTWQTATDLVHLKELFKTSNEKDFGELLGVKRKRTPGDEPGTSKDADDDDDKASPNKKLRTPDSNQTTKKDANKIPKDEKTRRKQDHSSNGESSHIKKENNSENSSKSPRAEQKHKQSNEDRDRSKHEAKKVKQEEDDEDTASTVVKKEHKVKQSDGSGSSGSSGDESRKRSRNDDGSDEDEESPAKKVSSPNT